jgi:hypothetical protein
MGADGVAENLVFCCWIIISHHRPSNSSTRTRLKSHTSSNNMPDESTIQSTPSTGEIAPDLPQQEDAGSTAQASRTATESQGGSDKNSDFKGEIEVGVHCSNGKASEASHRY